MNGVEYRSDHLLVFDWGVRPTPTTSSAAKVAGVEKFVDEVIAVLPSELIVVFTKFNAVPGPLAFIRFNMFVLGDCRSMIMLLSSAVMVRFMLKVTDISVMVAPAGIDTATEYAPCVPAGTGKPVLFVKEATIGISPPVAVNNAAGPLAHTRAGDGAINNGNAEALITAFTVAVLLQVPLL